MMTREDRRFEILKAAEEYHPCNCGVHVCGVTADGDRPLTIANIPARNEAEARRVWQACKQEAEATDEDGHDFCVDLNVGPWVEHVDDFWMTRQMLDRCLAAGRAALPE